MIASRLATKRRALVIGAIGALLLVVTIATRIVAPGWWFHIAKAHELQRAVDAYRQRHGRFPDVSDEPLMRKLGFDYGVAPLPEFIPIDGTHYRLIFTEGFDICWTFSSRTDSWTEDCSP
jgi:hypothetical protein